MRAGAGAIAHADSRYLTLACAGVDLVTDGRGGLVGRFRLRAGEQRWVVLTHADDPDRAEEALIPVRVRRAARAHCSLLGGLGRQMHVPRALPRPGTA